MRLQELKLDLEQIIAYDTYDKIKTMGSFIIIDRVTNNTVGAGMIRSKSSDQSKKDSSYSAFEIEFNALVRKHFPHWECKEIFNGVKMSININIEKLKKI